MPHMEVSGDMNSTVHLACSKEVSPNYGRAWKGMCLCASPMCQLPMPSRTGQFAPALGKEEGLERRPSKQGLLHSLGNPTAEVHLSMPQQLYLG